MQDWKHPWFEPAMLVGVKAGGFTLENVLGSGGFGAVYFTRNEQGQPLAVKVLFPPRSPESADMADYTSRLGHFTREILFAAGFHHRNIMRVHFAGSLLWHYDDSSGSQPGSYRSVDYNLPYYVTDHLPDSVEQRLGRRLFSSAEAVEIGKQFCDALEVLHGADPSILHLDINPSNVRLADGNKVVITDFGLVRVEGMRGEGTREPDWIPSYVAAPEQRAGEELDIRTDIYQVGALLFLMVTGKTRREFAVMTLLDQPNVPQSLARVIERCTRHDKELRFQDATGLKEGLAASKASHVERYVQMPIRRLADHLSRVGEVADAHVPPLSKSPVTWLLGAVLVFGILWFLGIILPQQPLTITIASSSTKKDWLIQAVGAFNEASRVDASLQIDGNPIRLKDMPIIVEILLEEIEPGVFDHYRSGSMIEDILSSEIKPTIASPAEQPWVQNLRAEWLGSRPIATDEGTGLLRTPLVIAMWRSRAEALGCWPTSGPTCTWETLRALASSTDGWGMFGHAEWGEMKFGYGHVGKSNSATFTQVLNCMSGLKITNGLTIDDVRADTPCGEAMAALENADIHIFPKSGAALTKMRVVGPGPNALDAATSYEADVIALAEEFGTILAEPIVAVYPQDGTIAPTHPFAILDGAPWADPKQAEAAAVFLQFLLSDEQQSRLVTHGLRPTDPLASLGPPVDRPHGADQAANLVMVEVPGTQVIKAVVELWECRLGDCPK